MTCTDYKTVVQNLEREVAYLERTYKRTDITEKTREQIAEDLVVLAPQLQMLKASRFYHK